MLCVAALLWSAPPSVFRTLFQVPYPATPLFATLTKTAGVCTNNSHSGTCYPTGLTASLSPYLLTSLPHYVLTSLLHDRRCSARPLQHGSRRVGFFPDVAHANDASWIPDSCGSGDVADFFSVESQERFRFGDDIPGKSQPHALAVDLAAGAHALDDLLAGVAAFGVADVGVLQAGLVRDLFFAEVVAEPRHALSQAGCAQRRVSHGAAAVLPRRFRKNLPKLRQFFALGDELRARDSSRRALDQSTRNAATGNRADSSIVGGKVVKLREVDAGKLLSNRGGLRALQRERAVACCLVGQRYVIHDDVFVEPLDQALANHGVGDAEEPVRKRIRFDLGDDMPLRIQQQGDDAVVCREILDVVRQDGVEVADPVRPGEGEIRAVVLVDQRHRLARIAILGGRIAKVIRQSAPQPNAHFRARANVHARKRSPQRCNFRSAVGCTGRRTSGFAGACIMRSHFHAFARPPVIRSVAKASLAKGGLSKLILSTSGADPAAPLKNPIISDDIITRMSDGRPSLNAAHDGLIQITIPVGMLQCNCSIIGDPVTREALVVHPADEANRILPLPGRPKLTAKAT